MQIADAIAQLETEDETALALGQQICQACGDLIQAYEGYAEAMFQHQLDRDAESTARWNAFNRTQAV